MLTLLKTKKEAQKYRYNQHGHGPAKLYCKQHAKDAEKQP